MARINILEKHVAELIAAGEVVERPASVIKELVENSIDAGATAVIVEIQRGGITFMRVTDNGCGIDKLDVCSAFLRHATSKVSCAEDLDAIGSLGFRGEALASISAVSRVELITRPPGNEIGARVLMSAGETQLVQDAGCPVGTTIVVRDIFYNVPARMKFLKKDVGEGNAIAGIIDKIALSHPEVSFKLIRDHKEVMYTPGDNKLSSAIYGVYGKEFLASLIPVEYKLEGIKITGYISKPTQARPNRAMQSFFINGRYVRSRTAFAALEEAFKGSLVQGKFPACVIHMQMNFALLDVNVHPSKLEVRFANEKPIFDIIYHGTKSALSKGDGPRVMPIVPKILPPMPVVQQMVLSKQQAAVPSSTSSRNFRSEETAAVQQNYKSLHDSEEVKIKPKQVETSIEALLNKAVMPEQALETQETTPELSVNEVVSDATAKIIGEAFTTYIVAEYANSLMLIDKHAAHERLLYEELKKSKPGSEAQTLIAPLTVTLDKQSYGALLECLKELDAAGFQIEDFGAGTVIVRSAPLSLAGTDAAQAVTEIAGYLSLNKNRLATEHLDWLYHNVACRAAVKGGKKSSNAELAALAKRLHENPDIRYCPHGRPIYVLIEKKDIERQFERA